MTNDNERSAEDYAAQALQLLAQSDAEFDSGDDRQGAANLFGSVTQAVIAASKQRGWDYDSYHANMHAVSRLAEEFEDDFMILGFMAAGHFRTHAKYGDMEDYAIAIDRPVIRNYVRRLLDRVNPYELNGNSQRTS